MPGKILAWKPGKVCTSFLYEIMYEFFMYEIMYEIFCTRLCTRFVRDYVRERDYVRVCRECTRLLEFLYEIMYKVEKYVLLENSNTGESDNDNKIYKWYLNQCRE
jgi:hypothetical protein